MKTPCSIAVAAVILCLGAAGESRGAFLLVRKDGGTVWASSARREGDVVQYRERDSGEDRSVPVAELDGVVPVVKRGKQYDAKLVQTFVDRLEDLKGKHPRQLRTLNQLLQEWKVLQAPVAELDDRITQLVREYQQGDKTTESYKKVVLDLGMLKYKDMRGAYTARIDEECARITGDHVARALKHLSEVAGAPEIGIERFVEVRYLCEHLLQVAEADTQLTVRNYLAACRKKAFEGNCRKSAETFTAGRKTVDVYLAASRILHGVKEEIAATEAQKADVAGRIEDLVRQATAAQRAYRFDYKGYPLRREDVELYNRAKDYTSCLTFAFIPVSDQCLIIPREIPKPAAMGRSFTVPVRLIFNRAQPPDRRLGVVVMLCGEGEVTHSHTEELESLRIKDGHVDITFRGDLSKVGKDFAPVPDKAGRTNVYVYLAYREDAGEGEYRWPAISHACRWPLR